MKLSMKLIPIALLLAAVAAPAALRAQTASPEPAADPADTLRAVDMAAVDELPSLVDRAEVARVLDALYPQTLKASGVSGTVKVRFVVDARGRALAPRVAEASTHAALDSAALRAVDAMRFVPARTGGEPQPVWVEIPVTFASAPAPAGESQAGEAAGEPELPAELVKAWADSAGALGPSEVDGRPELRDPAAAVRTLREAYPRTLREARVRGTATVWFVVDRDGAPGRARVAVSAGHPDLDDAALRAVETLRFHPARRRGEAVDSWMALPVAFQPPPAARAVREARPDSLGAYELSSVETLPELANRTEVAREISRVYPPALRDRGVTGTVSLRFLVDSLGIPGEPVLEHTTQPELGAAAMQVVKMMRFVPAQVRGKKVRVWVTLPISFQLGRDPMENTPPSQRRPLPGRRVDPWGNPWP
jgi:periplasmic protein TonB